LLLQLQQMATLKHIYDFVHSLDKTEKKSVSLLIDTLGGKAKERYAHTFKILNEQKTFDADKLKPKLAKDVSGMNLTEANDNFFNFLCKCIVSHPVQSSGNLGLLKEMVLVETFISKGLFDLADKHLEPLIQKLQKGNSFGLLSRGQELQSIVTASNASTTGDFKRRKQLIAERMQTAVDHQQYLQVMQLNQELNELIHNIGEPREAAHFEQYRKIYHHPVWRLSYAEVSRQAFTMYAPLKTQIFEIVEGSRAAIAECEIALAEFHKRFNLSDHYVPAFYLLDNVLSDSIRIKGKEEVNKYTQALRELLPYIQQVAVYQKVQAKIMQGELSSALITKDYEAGVKTLEAWMQPPLLETWAAAPLAYMNHLFGARLHYMNNNPERALDYLNMLQGQEKDFRASSLLSYRFLYLFCYYQLNNHSLIFSTATSIYKSLLKQEKLYAPERAILKFSKASGTVEKMKSNLNELYETLKALSEDPFHHTFFQFADYVEWLEKELKK